MAVEHLATSLDRVPPHSISAEESVLGSMILRHQAVAVAQEILQPDDFYKESHRKIYRTLIELYSGGSPTDPVVLVEELKRRGMLEAVGDRAYIISLVDTTPNPENIKNYAHIVRDMSVRRQLIDVGFNVTGMGYNTSDDVEELYDHAEDALFRLGKRMRREGLAHIREPIKQSFDRMSEAMEMGTSITGIPTGYYDLDRLTSGLQRSNLIIVGGRTSMGKTSLALNIAHHAGIHCGKGVLIFSLEMSKVEIAERFLISEARVDSSRYRRGDVGDEWERIIEAAGVLGDAPIFIDDTGDISIMEIRTIARQLMSKEKNIGLIIVDYIQLMYGGKGDTRRYESRAQEVSKIARDLKVLAMDLEIPVLAVSQLRRPPATVAKKDPSLEDLKESGGIEQNADIVLLIYRPIVDDPSNLDLKGVADINLAKNRNGRTARFKLLWFDSYSKFENPAEDDRLPD
jgi:replicative DNA helicase